MTGAFYGFQLAPDVRQVIPCPEDEATGAGEPCGWLGWFLGKAQPLIHTGHHLHHLHNPFGLYDLRDRYMHIDQFYLAQRAGLDWLADPCRFASAVELVHQAGGRVHTYVGSPLAIHPRRRLGRCTAWERRITRHIHVLLDAGVDAIGFDASADFETGDCMSRLVERLLTRGTEVMIEPWPRVNRDYPPVNWIIRERLYHRIRLRPKPDEAPIEQVGGQIYRILPAHDTPAGQEEIQEINDLTGHSYHHTQELVESAQNDGHIPLVRVHQLLSGSVT